MRGKEETELRQRLTGHEVGNDGDSQGEAYELPRHFPTLHVVRAGRVCPAILDGRERR